MKTIMYLFSFVMLTSMTIKMDVTPTDPIPGVDVKLGRRPPGSGQIIATGVTDKNGTVEFKNLAAGTGYYLEFGIREKGIRGGEQIIRIEGIESKSTVNSTTNQKGMSERKVITQKSGDIEITVTYQDNWVSAVTKSEAAKNGK